MLYSEFVICLYFRTLLDVVDNDKPEKACKKEKDDASSKEQDPHVLACFLKHL